MTVEKPKPKQLLRPITTGTNSSMNQAQFLAITRNSPEAREISRVHGAIGFGFASHWLKNWRESFKPITKRRNRNHVITFDSYLKTAKSSRKDIWPMFLTIFPLHAQFILVVGSGECCLCPSSTRNLVFCTPVVCLPSALSVGIFSVW